MALFPKTYENEWRLYKMCNVFKTPSFSHFSATFQFEARYIIEDSIPAVSIFKLNLIFLKSSSSFEVSVDVKVYHSDGSLFMEYPNMQSKYSIIFNDVILPLTDRSGHHFEHVYKMASNSIILKCVMTLPGKNFTAEEEMKSSKHLDLIENLKSVYEPSVLSDFTFKVGVGDRSFPAHKVILAAHSLAFKKKFLESKTNSVTITDATPEIFDVFLTFLYSGEIEDKSWDSLKELYYLADKYDVGFLKKECIFAVTSVLTVDSVCEILIWAYSNSNSGFKNAPQILQSITSKNLF